MGTSMEASQAQDNVALNTLAEVAGYMLRLDPIDDRLNPYASNEISYLETSSVGSEPCNTGRKHDSGPLKRRKVTSLSGDDYDSAISVASPASSAERSLPSPSPPPPQPPRPGSSQIPGPTCRPEDRKIDVKESLQVSSHQAEGSHGPRRISSTEDHDTPSYEARFRARVEAVNRQQTRLSRDSRVLSLRERFKRAPDVLPDTFYADMALLGTFVLDNGQPAQTGCSPEEADFIVCNNKEYSQWLDNGAGDKLVILRDRPALNERPHASSEGMLEDILDYDPESMIDVQDLGENLNQRIAVKTMPIGVVAKRMKSHDEKIAPLNCLDIACKTDVTPSPLLRSCDELTKAAVYADSQAHRRHKDRASGFGKKKVETKHTHAIDIEQCLKFQINGQAGAFSSWHMDNMGVGTFVTLEPTSRERSKDTYSSREKENTIAYKYDNFYWASEDEEVLKLWAFVRLDHLSEEIRNVQLADFAAHSINWRPPPDLIKIIALIRGDTLIMPPGTIHAPVTITNCLFRGGMIMQRRNLKRTMKYWRFLSDNPFCTNEDKPKETRAVIDYLQGLVHRNPAAAGFEAKDIQSFDADCRSISAASLSCDCVKGLCGTPSCGCQKFGQRCGPSCHASRERKESCCNPFGHEESRREELERRKIQWSLRSDVAALKKEPPASFSAEPA